MTGDNNMLATASSSSGETVAVFGRLAKNLYKKEGRGGLIFTGFSDTVCLAGFLASLSSSLVLLNVQTSDRKELLVATLFGMEGNLPREPRLC
jgi:hypothetical protein